MNSIPFPSFFKSAALLIVLSLSAFQTLAHADLDLSGSYRGLVSGAHKTRADLILYSLRDEHRGGSYLALLVLENPNRVAIYQADGIDDHHFSLTPRQVTSDGALVGIDNASPSLVLNVDRPDPRGESMLSLVDAHSSNVSEFQGSIVFSDRGSSDLSWTDYTPGKYEGKGFVANLGDDPETPSVLALPNPISGTFLLRREFHGVYSVDGIALTGAGDQMERYPHRILIFLRRGHQDHVIFVNPGSYRDLLDLRRTN